MIIVTGGAGFIGSAVLWQLNRSGIDNILVVDNLASSEKWKNLVNRKFKDYLQKLEFLELLLSGKLEEITAIIHMGACSSTTETDADYLMRNNFHYSKTLAEFALSRNIRFVNASSAATYGDGAAGFSDDTEGLDSLKPLNMYGYSKHLFDLWAHSTGALKRLASLKFFNVFGPNEYHKGDMSSVIYKAFFQVRDTGRIRLFKSYKEEYPDGGQMRDFVYVKDCAAIIGWLLEHPEANGLFNVGASRARTWNDLAAAVFSAMNLEPVVEYIDMPLSLRDRYQYFTCADTEKLAKAGCSVPFTVLEEAAADYIGNYLQQPDPYL